MAADEILFLMEHLSTYVLMEKFLLDALPAILLARAVVYAAADDDGGDSTSEATNFLVSNSCHVRQVKSPFALQVPKSHVSPLNRPSYD